MNSDKITWDNFSGVMNEKTGEIDRYYYHDKFGNSDIDLLKEEDCIKIIKTQSTGDEPLI